MLEEKFDFVIIVNSLSTNFTDSRNNELIELNWCTYDLKKKSVNSELGAFIRPNQIKDISGSFLQEHNVSGPQLETADDLLEVLKKFNRFIFESFISKNFSFAFLTKDDSLLGKNGSLISEALLKNVKLGYHFSKYFNLIKEFKTFYKVDKIGSNENPDLSDILQYYSLKKTEMERPTLQELNTMVRIVNRMVKEGYEFSSIRLITSEGRENEKTTVEKTSEKEVDINAIFIKNETEKLEKQSITANEVTQYNFIKSNLYYIRIKNLPLFIGKKDITDLFYLYQINPEDIAIAYDIFGRRTGKAVTKVYNESNYRQIISVYNLRLHLNKLIEVHSTDEAEYISCQNSETVVIHKKIFIKMKNIPYSSKVDTIRNFFKFFSLSENGVKLLKNKKGTFLGEAVVAFISEEEAGKAIKEKNGDTLMNQMVSLEWTTLDEFELFASTEAFSFTIRSLCDYVTPDLVTRSLFINGLPLDLTKEEFLSHVEVFNLDESNLIYDEKGFTLFGCLIMTLPSEEDAAFVRNYLSRTSFKHKNREKKISAHDLLLLVNKGNES